MSMLGAGWWTRHKNCSWATQQPETAGCLDLPEQGFPKNTAATVIWAAEQTWCLAPLRSLRFSLLSSQWPPNVLTNYGSSWMLQLSALNHWNSRICTIFSQWRNSVTHLYFMCSSTSATILSDCPFAAICHMTTTCNRILVGRFSFYCHTTNIYLWHRPR